MSKSQLHQLLPAESDLQSIVRKLTDEAKNTFKKQERFSGTVRILNMFDEERKGEETTEVSEVTTTVPDKLAYLRPTIEKYYDAFLQKETTNQSASADIVIDGVTIASNIAATALLGLESKLKELRTLYDVIPTHAPGIKWEPDSDHPGIFRDIIQRETSKTEKSFRFEIVAPATKEHKAQYEKWPNDKAVGKYVTTNRTGTISPGDKSVLLAKIDQLIIAVKQARQRANNTEVVDAHIGKNLFDFIHSEG